MGKPKSGIDSSLLTDEESKRYDLLLSRRNHMQLSEAQADRMRRLKWYYIFAGVSATFIATLVAGIAGGAPWVGGTLALSGFFSICVFGVAAGLHEDSLKSRWAASWRNATASEFLDSIGYAQRTERPRPTRGGYDYGRAKHWHVDGYDHSRHRGMFSSSDRERMNNAGMSADEYVNNVLEAE